MGCGFRGFVWRIYDHNIIMPIIFLSFMTIYITYNCPLIPLFCCILLMTQLWWKLNYICWPLVFSLCYSWACIEGWPLVFVFCGVWVSMCKGSALRSCELSWLMLTLFLQVQSLSESPKASIEAILQWVCAQSNSHSSSRSPTRLSHSLSSSTERYVCLHCYLYLCNETLWRDGDKSAVIDGIFCI